MGDNIWESILYKWQVSNDFFKYYMGTGLIVIWYLAATIYLLVREKRKPVRILFVYVPLILLLIFFNPLITLVIYHYVDTEIYYRILWLLPMTVVIAFAIVEIYGRLKGKQRTFFAITAALLVMVSGSFVYRDPLFSKAENAYHVPQSVVDICDAIEVEGREVMAVFPSELIQYVRQYSPVVCMPYGREITVERWNYTTENALFDAMEAEVIDAEQLSGLAREAACAYIILPEDKGTDGDLKDYDYETFGQVEGYVIYKDSTVDLEIIFK